MQHQFRPSLVFHFELFEPKVSFVFFQVHNGPSTALVLKAHVTLPDMTVSDSVLDFGHVLCSQCKIITIQFFNHKKVPCEWAVVTQQNSAEAMSRKSDNEFDWTPSRKKQEKAKKETKNLNVFEVIPNRGVLLPGQRYNVQVKFMPLLQVRSFPRLWIMHSLLDRIIREISLKILQSP